MKAAFFLIGLLFGWSAMQEPAVKEAEDVGRHHAEIDGFLETWLSAFRANDWKAMKDLYAEADTTTLIVSAGMRMQGRAAIREVYVDSFARVRFESVEMKKLTKQVMGDTACISGEFLSQVTVQDDATKWETHIHTSLVLQRISGKWKIILEHSSPIMDIPRLQQVNES